MIVSRESELMDTKQSGAVSSLSSQLAARQGRLMEAEICSSEATNLDDKVSSEYMIVDDGNATKVNCTPGQLDSM